MEEVAPYLLGLAAALGIGLAVAWMLDRSHIRPVVLAAYAHAAAGAAGAAAAAFALFRSADRIQAAMAPLAVLILAAALGAGAIILRDRLRGGAVGAVLIATHAMLGFTACVIVLAVMLG